MSDFEPTPVVTEEPEGEFFNETETGVALPDPASVITLRTSGGDTRYVPAAGPMTVADVIAASGVFVGGQSQYWLNGAQVQMGDTVPAGATLTLVGSVKGG